MVNYRSRINKTITLPLIKSIKMELDKGEQSTNGKGDQILNAKRKKTKMQSKTDNNKQADENGALLCVFRKTCQVGSTVPFSGTKYSKVQ